MVCKQQRGSDPGIRPGCCEHAPTSTVRFGEGRRYRVRPMVRTCSLHLRKPKERSTAPQFYPHHVARCPRQGWRKSPQQATASLIQRNTKGNQPTSDTIPPPLSSPRFLLSPFPHLRTPVTYRSTAASKEALLSAIGPPPQPAGLQTLRHFRHHLTVNSNTPPPS